MATTDLSNPLSKVETILQFGAGSWFIDRYLDNGGVRGAEAYVGDTVAAELSATVERTTVFSGDGAVATQLLDKVRQVQYALGITPQDSTMDNIALYLMASAPADVTALDATQNLVTVFNLPADASERTYFQIGASAADPAGRPAFTLADAPIAAADGFKKKNIGAGGARANQATVEGTDYEIDYDTGRLRFTEAGLAKLLGDPKVGQDVEITILAAKVTAGAAFPRVSVPVGARQVRVAARYIEQPDAGTPGRNLYIPKASISPNGAAQLKSRDTPQQWPLSLAIENPGGSLPLAYVDGVPI